MLFKEINELLEAMRNDEKLYPNIAKSLKKLYDTLIEEGFSEETATKIVANHKVN